MRVEQNTAHGWLKFMAHSPEGKSLGIFGLGSIGKQVVKRAKAFDMKLFYHKRTRLEEQEEKELEVTYLTKDQILEQCDYILLCMPSVPETYRYLDHAEFDKMKKGVYIINVARGELINEKALVDNLKSGKVAGAGLDVFEFEPNVVPELFELPNVSLTPHIGTATVETRAAMEELALANVEAVLAGKSPLTPVPECSHLKVEATS